MLGARSLCHVTIRFGRQTIVVILQILALILENQQQEKQSNITYENI